MYKQQIKTHSKKDKSQLFFIKKDNTSYYVKNGKFADGKLFNLASAFKFHSVPFNKIDNDSFFDIYTITSTMSQRIPLSTKAA